MARWGRGGLGLTLATLLATCSLLHLASAQKKTNVDKIAEKLKKHAEKFPSTEKPKLVTGKRGNVNAGAVR